MAINLFPSNGLFTTPNVFDDSPQGSLAVALNVQFTSDSVLEPRRGYELHDGTFGSSSSRANSFGFYTNSNVDLVFVQYDASTVAWQQFGVGGTFTDLTGTFAPVDVRMRFVEAARDVFFNANTGCYMVSNDGVVDVEAVKAGAPVGLSILPVGSNQSTLFAAGTSASYCFTMCQLDAYQRVIEGPPSPSMKFANVNVAQVGGMTRVGTTVTVTLTQWTNLLVGQVVTLTPGEANFAAGNKTITSVTPTTFKFTYTEAGAAASSTVQEFFNIARNTTVPCYFGTQGSEKYFIRLYRTEFVTSGEPSQEFFQAYESAFLTGTDVSNGYLVIEDTTPEIFLSTPLYTNPNTGETEAQAAYEPPRCLDMTYWGDRMWFANTTQKASFNLNMLGVGSPNGVQINDTIKIGGGEWTFVASRSAAFEVTLITAGDAARNVKDTAINLVNAVNLDSGSAFGTPIFAQYITPPTAFPGQMFFFSSTFTNSFSVLASRTASWAPQLSTDSDNPTQAQSNAHAARLYYSKLGIPEAVPLLNYLQIDADNHEILRIFPLNYRLYVFKTDGMYYVQGNDASTFSVQKFSEARLVAPDSVGVLNERLYCFTTQGFGTVVDSTFTPMSQPVDDALNDLFGSLLATAKEQGVGLGYESARQYVCYLPNPSDVGSAANLGWVYSILSGGFTNWDGTVRAAAVRLEDDKLWVAPGDRNQLIKERKSFTNADFCDVPYTINGVNSHTVDGNTTVMTVTNAEDVSVGDVIVATGLVGPPVTFAFLIIDVDVDAQQITLLGSAEFSGTGYFTFKSYPCEVTYNKSTGGTPASLKEFTQSSVLWKLNDVYTVEVGMESEVTTLAETVDLVHVAWGFAPYGEFPWGCPTEQLRRIQPLPVNMANCAQLSIGFSLRQALAAWQHVGVVLEANYDTDANRG
jgi:hypothetical protein